MAEIRFEKLYRYSRIAEPCVLAFPIEKSKLFYPEQISIQNEKKEEVSCQVKVTSRWEDGSIRWLLCRFFADLPANQGVSYTLEWKEKKEKEEIKKELAWIDKNGKICIDTGELKIKLGGEEKGIFEEITFQKSCYKRKELLGPILRDKAGKTYELFINNWKITENGFLCTIIEGEGYHTAEGEKRKTEVRMTFYQGKPWFELAYRLINDSEEPLEINSLELQIKRRILMGTVTNCAASSNYKTKYKIASSKEEEEDVDYLIDSQYLLYEANEHMAEVFYGTLFAAQEDVYGGVCATVYQAHQNFPKGVYAGKEGIIIKLIPECEDKIVMQPGMAREQKIQLHFYSAKTTKEELNHRSLLYQMPDRPILEPEIYHKAEVFPDVFVQNKNNKVEMALIEKADKHARCYGMLNWGDAPDPGYTMQGRGKGEVVWTNNEYDYPHACILQYVRTGIRRFLDYALVAAKHWMDVDICHYSSNPLHYQGQWEHTRGHVLEGEIVCSHQWVEGLIDYYHFTGEEKALETAVGIGKNIKRLLETPMFQQKGEINARETGWALRSLTALYIETQEKSWLEKCDWIVGHFEEWKKEFGGWLSPYTDNTAIRIPFMISVAVGSLMRYYRVSPQEKIKKMIIEAMEDLLENTYLDCGLFLYKELPSLSRLGNNTLILEALTYAYELTKDTKYLDAGRQTFEDAINSGTGNSVNSKRIEKDAVIVNGPGTKNFAQSFLPITIYYKKIMEKKDNIIIEK